jgi:hypothetical protein
MKTAGEILSTLFDEQFMKKAQGYSKLFDSWVDITAKNGIASAADHSRIRELDRGILLVETDHPGWKQILQTKQSKLLNDFRRRFPDMDISAISLMLSRDLSRSEPETDEKTKTEIVEEPPMPDTAETTEQPAIEEPSASGYDAIRDRAFREKLIKLGESIAEREKV